jgi:hypothetical protein
VGLFVRKGSRRSFAIAASLLGGACAVLSVLASWTLTHTTDTSTYVRTADLVIDQAQVQDEIASTIVTSVVGETPLPDEIVALLNSGARLIVGSDGFHKFWRIANQSMHQIVREQLLGNELIDPMGARIDITTEVNLVLENLRQIDPRLAGLLPDNAPETAVQIVDQKTLTDIRNAISGLEHLKTFGALFAVALFVLSTVLLGLRRRSLVLTSCTLIITALAVYGISSVLPPLAQRFVDKEFQGTTYVVATQMASTMTTTAWQILFAALVGFVIAFFPHRKVSDASE